MLMRDFMIAIIIFGIVLTGFAVIASEMADKYSLSVDTSFNSTYSTINNMSDRSSNMYNTYQTGEKSASGFIGMTLSTIGDIISMVITSFSVAFGVINQIAIDLMIPSWLILSISSILLILIVLAIISMIMKTRV
jgi:hypothetical protein